MFKVENNVPKFYSEESRDFQLLCKLYDIVLQSTRFSIDSMRGFSDATLCNKSMLQQVGTKVGYFHKIDTFSSDQVSIMLKAFPKIIKYKGSMKSIYLTLNLFEHLANTQIIDNYKDNVLSIEYINTDSETIDLLDTVLSYIKPTGMMIDYTITSDVSAETKTALIHSDVETAYKEDEELTKVDKESRLGYSVVGYSGKEADINELSNII